VRQVQTDRHAAPTYVVRVDAIAVERLVPVAFVSSPTTQFFVPLPLPRSEARLFTALLQACSTSVRFKGPHLKNNGESRMMKEKNGPLNSRMWFLPNSSLTAPLPPSNKLVIT